jgi:hypothetical protein
MHLDAGDIQRVLHGELPPDGAAAAERHLDACPDCAAALAEAAKEESDIYGALAALDHDAPTLTASFVLGRSQGTLRPPARLPWMRWAAAIVLGLGVAGVAYAAPGSPLRDWIAALTEDAPRPSPPEPSPPTQTAASGGGGVGVPPEDFLQVELSGGTSGAAVRLLFADAGELRASGGSGQVSYSLAPGRLLVGPVGADTIQLEVPRSAPRVEVRSDGRPVAVAERGVLLVGGAPVSGAGPFVLGLSEVSP